MYFYTTAIFSFSLAESYRVVQLPSANAGNMSTSIFFMLDNLIDFSIFTIRHPALHASGMTSIAHSVLVSITHKAGVESEEGDPPRHDSFIDAQFDINSKLCYSKFVFGQFPAAPATSLTTHMTAQY